MAGFSLKEVKELFVVDRESYNEKKLPGLVDRALLFAKVDKSGSVLLEKNPFTNSDYIRLVLVCRFLANKLDKTIAPIVTIEELSDFTHINKKIIAARVKELVEQKQVKREKKGKYSISPFQIEDILDSLYRKHSKKEQKSEPRGR
ncbi:MAG: hypothetical protein HY394_02905 [Candidatus Diapherotrites archaeon]|nr:hypothetical protein [Candidatus Diapherotrites archaeon]